MNLLQESIDKLQSMWQNIVDEGKLRPVHKDFFKNILVEYAKHELDEAPENIEEYCDNETRRSFKADYSSKMNAYFCGMNSAIREKLASIEKDIQTLNK